MKKRLKARLDDDLVEFAAYDALEECGLTTAETRKTANQFWNIFTCKVSVSNRQRRTERTKTIIHAYICGLVCGTVMSLVKYFWFR